jgi:hypothetical protein
MSNTKPDAAAVALSWNDKNVPVVLADGREASSLADLARLPILARPESLGLYCDAVNHLKYGRDYRVIHDPAAYAAKYQRRLAAEDPKAPWREGVVRLRDFGVCDTSLIHAPLLKGSAVTYFAEDNFLGIPYRVTAPAPGHPGGEIRYDPLPMKPLPAPPDAPPADHTPRPVEPIAPPPPEVETAPLPLTPHLPGR